MIEQFKYYLVFSLSYFVAGLAVTSSLKRRKKEGFFYIIVLLISCVLSLVFAILLVDLKANNYTSYKAITPLVFTILTIPTLIHLFYFIKESLSTRIYMFVATTLVYNTSSSIYNMIFYAYADLANTGYYQASKTLGIWFFISILCKILWFLLVFFIFKKYASVNKLFHINKIITALFVIAEVAIFLIAPMLNDRIMPTKYLFRVSLGTFCFYIISLSMIFVLSFVNESKLRMNQINKIVIASMKEYEITKENIEIINQKCHDMRHQIRVAQKSGKLNDEFVNDTLKSINIYDCKTKTGNDILDVIITNTKLRCNANDIELNVIVDGKLMDFMREDYLISLFSNLLENATNYEIRVKDKEKRKILLKVYSWNSFIKIHCENYYTDNVFEEEKKNEHYHGFGIQSMKTIIEKYNGRYLSTIKNNNFVVDIIFKK